MEMWVPFQIYLLLFHGWHHLYLSKFSKTQISNDLKSFNQSSNYFHVHIHRTLYYCSFGFRINLKGLYLNVFQTPYFIIVVKNKNKPQQISIQYTLYPFERAMSILHGSHMAEYFHKSSI